MAKQQSEAQNEALRSFQETIASVVVPLSQRHPTAVHLLEKYPTFLDWDGDRTHLLLWLHQVDQIRQTKEITDTVAVRFVRNAMGVAAYGHFKEVPPSWAAFVKVLEDRFMPSDIKNRLTEELCRLKMDGDDFNRYFSQFQAYCQHTQTTDESMLVMFFIRGLEITLQHAVQHRRKDHQPGQSRNPRKRFSTGTHCNDYPPHHHHQPRHHGTSSTEQPRCSGT